jgi:O-methyltransferase
MRPTSLLKFKSTIKSKHIVNLSAKSVLKNLIRRTGFDIVRISERTTLNLPTPEIFDSLADLTQAEKEILVKAKPFTMTSSERMAALLNATTYVTRNKISGDIAECGVWRGGSMMIIALTLIAHGDLSRSLYLYDTYEGMSPPTDDDRSFDEFPAEALLRREQRRTGIWCYASIEDVYANILSTGYPANKVHLVKGKVEDTIPATLPPQLALLRLDTDWYESTKHELQHLFPKLDRNGILIIDDYGHWKGAKKAVDEYFHNQGYKVYLHRIDYTGRILVRSGCKSNE